MIRLPSKCTFATAAAFAVAFMLLAWRSLYSIDWTDESYCVAEAWRIICGDLMFKWDWSPHQLAAMVYSPLVWAYSRLTGSTDGIILFLRLCHAAAAAGVTTLLFHATSKSVGVAWGGLAGAPALFCLTPAAFSYNSIQLLALFAACGALLEARGGAGGEASPAWLVLAGTAAGTAFVAYPTDLLTLPVFCLWAAVGLGSGTNVHGAVRNLALFAAGCVICLGFVATFLLTTGSLSYSFSDWPNVFGGGRGDPSTHSLPEHLTSLAALYGTPYSGALLTLCVFGFAAGRIRKEGGRAITRCAVLCGLALLLALQCLRPIPELETRQVQMQIFFCLSSAIPVLFLLSGCTWHDSLWMAILGALSSVAVYWVTVNNGVTLYIYPFALTASATVLYFASVRNTLLSNTASKTAAASLVALLLAASGFACLWYVHRDAPLPQLDTIIDEGPGSGLHTTKERAEQYRELTTAISDNMPRKGNVLFAPVLPFGYLCSNALPAAPSTWSSAFDNPVILERYSCYYAANPEKLPSAICVPDAVFDARNNTEGFAVFVSQTMGERSYTVVETELATFFLFDSTGKIA